MVSIEDLEELLNDCSEDMLDDLREFIANVKAGEVDKAVIRHFFTDGSFQDIAYGFDSEEEEKAALALLEKECSGQAEH